MSKKIKNEKSLKAQNLYLLGIFIILNILVYIILLVEKNITFDNIENIWKRLTLKDGLLITVIPLISIILNGILSSNFKAILVFWRFKNPLPGSRAFTELAKTDSRIDINIVNNLIDKIPETAQEQNAAFYKIYKRFENKIIVKDAHKQFLLTRDIAGYSFLFLVLFISIFIFIENEFYLKLIYLAYLFLQYIILSIVSRNYGNRFVCNVLAEASIV